MIAFYIALVVGGSVAVAYLGLAFEEFQRSRRTYGKAAEESADPAFDAQGRGFTWIALGGVVVSTSLLVLVSSWSWSWYLLPFLSIGSAFAVVLAFLVDRDQTESPQVSPSKAGRHS